MRTRSQQVTMIAVGSGLAVVFACGTQGAFESSAPPASAAHSPAASSSTPSSTAPATSSVPDATSLPTPRYRELRGVLHVHSAYSHDACDGKGLVGGVPNASCLADLRAAPCNVGLDFVNLTDHPAHMTDYEPTLNLLYDASKGDQLVMDADGVSPVGNLIQCPGGRKVLFTFGYEALHTMPLAFARHPTRFEEYTSTRPIAEVQALVADLHDAGALVALAHSEESDLTADTIVQGGADVMEWYNPHGNFKKTMGSDKVSGNPLALLAFFGGISDFLAGATGGAHPDLMILRLLQEWPTEGFTKWREVQKGRHVPGVLGSDVHQNISIDPVCTGASQILCASAANGKLAALALLVSGGQLVMSDQKRLDTYDRIMRWLHNRVLSNDLTPAGMKAALARGRSYGVFSVFGDPTGFVFEGEAGGRVLDMGDQATGPVMLTARVPAVPTPISGGAPFDASAAKSAIVRAVLFRTDASGTTEVATATTLGASLTKNVSEPGSYHVEIWIKPKHLQVALGPQAALANAEYLWLITNPIRITP